jgi:hypothetical protein
MEKLNMITRIATQVPVFKAEPVITAIRPGT